MFHVCATRFDVIENFIKFSHEAATSVLLLLCYYQSTVFGVGLGGSELKAHGTTTRVPVPFQPNGPWPVCADGLRRQMSQLGPSGIQDCFV